MIARVMPAVLSCIVVVSNIQAQAPKPAPPKKPVAAKPRLDALGDPLPDGALARLGTLRFKHVPAFDPTIDVALFSPDGTRIASLVYGHGSIRLWNAGSGKGIPGDWSTANRRFTAVAFSADSALLLAAAEAGPQRVAKKGKAAPAQREVIFYSTGTGKRTKAVGVGAQFVRALVLADKGKTLIAAGENTITWWDVGTGKQKRSWKVFNEKKPGQGGMIKNKTFDNCAIAPDGKSIAVNATWRLENPKGPVFQQQQPDQEAIGYVLATSKINWRAGGKKTYRTMSRLAYSADSKRLAIAPGPDRVEVRDAVTGKLIVSPLDSGLPNNNFHGGLAISPDGTLVALAGADSHVVVWSLKDARVAPARRKFVARIAQFWQASTQCLHFSPDSKRLLVGADADLQVYDVATLKEIKPSEGHRGWIDYLTFSADGKRLLTGCADMNLHSQELAAWDMKTWKRMQLTSLKAPPWPNVGIVSPDQSVYAVKDDPLALHDLKSGKLLARVNVPKTRPAKKKAGKGPPVNQRRFNGQPGRAFFSPNGKHYVLPAQDPDGRESEGLYAVPSGKFLCWLPPLAVTQPSMESCRPVAFSIDERLVALFTRTDTMVHVFDTVTGKPRCRLPAGSVPNPQNGAFACNLAFTRDGKLLASWHIAERLIRIWDLATGRELLALAPDEGPSNSPGHPMNQQRVHFGWSPDNRMLAVGQNKVRVWELASLGVRRELPGHADGPIRRVEFSPDGRVLATGSSDTTVLIWDMSLPNHAAVKGADLGPGELAKRWQTLAQPDAVRAFAAIRDLVAVPAQSVAWINEHLKPARPVDGKRVAELIVQLNNDRFRTRQRASAELLAIGEQVVPALDKALAANPSLEAQLRIQGLRKRLTGIVLNGGRLQGYRAVEVLERLGTPQARQVLASLSGGAAGAVVTTEAREALLRLYGK